MALRSLTEKYFPTPKYFIMNAVGFDLSEHSLKFLELERVEGKLVVGRYGKRKLAEGIVSEGKIVDEEAFSAHLRKIKKQHGFQYVRLSLPEEHSYLFRMEIPKDTPEDQLMGIVEFELKDNVPLSPSEVVFDYLELPHLSPRGTRLADVSVYPRELVDQYVRIFHNSGMHVRSLEVEGQAIARSLLPPKVSKAFLILDLGESEAGLYVVEDERLVFSATLEVGGLNLTHAIEEVLKVSYEEAEEMKRHKGILSHESNKMVRDALMAPLLVIEEEIARHIVYWREHDPTGELSHKNIEEVVLSGGNANIAGLPEFFSERLGLPVSKGNVWKNVCSFSEYIPPLHADDAVEYATAIGLALRSTQ